MTEEQVREGKVRLLGEGHCESFFPGIYKHIYLDPQKCVMVHAIIPAAFSQRFLMLYYEAFSRV